MCQLRLKKVCDSLKVILPIGLGARLIIRDSVKFPTKLYVKEHCRLLGIYTCVHWMQYALTPLTTFHWLMSYFC